MDSCKYRTCVFDSFVEFPVAYRKLTSVARNINVFGLVFVVTLSSVIVLIDITMLKFLIFLSKFRRALAPRIDRWIQDGALQLQRRAYESQGQGVWTNLSKDVPLTTEKVSLEDLPLESLPPFRKLRHVLEKDYKPRRADTEMTAVASPISPWTPSMKSKNSDPSFHSKMEMVGKDFSLQRTDTDYTMVASPVSLSPESRDYEDQIETVVNTPTIREDGSSPWERRKRAGL